MKREHAMNKRHLTRRQFLELSCFAAAGFTATDLIRVHTAGAQSEQTPAASSSNPDLETLADNIASGGPPEDGIPAVDRPRFVTAEEMDYFLEPQDRVFVLA
jgi:hypothetical protein